MYSVHCFLSSASCVTCVSESPIIWQLSLNLGVQNFSDLVQREHFQFWGGINDVGNSMENCPYLGNSER